MRVCIFNNYQEMSRIAAAIVGKCIQTKKGAVLGLATGSTPIGMYQELVRMHRSGELDFSQVITFNLDEYVGLSPLHPQSYHSFMQCHFFQHVNPPSNVHIPRGDAANLALECANYEAAMNQVGGIDIQILGIGSNGHIGFNEPGADAEGTTNVVKLSDCTIKSNARFFSSPNQVPGYAVSMGIKTILDKSKTILLLANGVDKAAAVRHMLTGEVTPAVPASLLRLHSDVTVLLDQAAAQELTERTFVSTESRSPIKFSFLKGKKDGKSTDVGRYRYYTFGNN
ncbi:MAG: glucosamine-6-phosphate isomerase [Bacilli bacterium]|nr:glucosamine-6-phosphate isomerase [Bacilli bacterium]